MNTGQNNEIKRKTQGSFVNTGEVTLIETKRRTKYVTEWVNNLPQRISDFTSTEDIPKTSMAYRIEKSSLRTTKNMDYINIEGSSNTSSYLHISFVIRSLNFTITIQITPTNFFAGYDDYSTFDYSMESTKAGTNDDEGIGELI